MVAAEQRMSAPISVIIPTWQAADRIGPSLGALGEALFEGLIREVIAADGGSTDAIADIADETGARLIRAKKGRGGQLAAGARAAQGRWLLFLHADSVPDPGWADAVRRHMTAHPLDAGYFRLRFATDGLPARWTAGWANLRARLFGLPYGDQGLLIPRHLYDQTGGFPEIPLMEDVALVRRLGRRLHPIACGISSSAERYLRDGWLRRGARNLWTLLRYLGGASPEVLARSYDRR